MDQFPSGVSASKDRLAEIYDEHASALFRFVLSLTRCEFVTEDVVQDVFFRLARDENGLRDIENVRSYLFRMAHRRILDLAKMQQRRQCRDVAASNPSVFAVAHDPDADTFMRQVEEALSMLPPDQRKVAYLKVWEGLTFQEIAAALEISAHTAASRCRSGLAKLRESLHGLYEEIQ